MRKSSMFPFLFCFVLALSVQAVAQVSGPPKVLLIEREEIKTGMFEAHERESNNFARLLSHAKTANEPVYTRFGMYPIAGNPNEVLYLYPFDSFAQWAQSQRDIERWMTRPGPMRTYFERMSNAPQAATGGDAADMHVSQSSMVGFYRPDLSHNPRKDISKARYMNVSKLHVKPGQMSSFMKAVAMYKEALSRAQGDNHFAVYEIVSGAPDGLFLAISTMESLAEMDKMMMQQGEFVKAMGDKMDEFEGLIGKSFGSAWSGTYAINPRMSNPPAEFVAADPQFWSQEMPPPPAAARTAPARRRQP